MGKRYVAELLTGFALVAGWALLTHGLALLLTPKVWPVSAGLLFLSAVGWRLIGTVAMEGLYKLTRDDA